MTEHDWAIARSEMMLDPSVVNLNTGSFGPTPRCVFERVTDLRRQQAAGPMEFLLRTSPPLLWHARERLASFLGASAERLVFTQNVSAAINIVASGLRLQSGEILMSDREYGAMAWCWRRAASQQGLAVRTFPLPLVPESPAEILESLAKAIRPETRLLFFSHVYSASGMIVPAREMCALARDRGILTVVDGAHAPGIVPLHIGEIGCDAYAGNCHKWLLAPIGAGFLVLSGELLNRLEPLQVSWGYHCEGPPNARDTFGSTPAIRRLEFEGTRDICPWMVVPDTLDFQERLGWNAVRDRGRALADRVRERLRSLRPATPSAPGMSGPMTAFWLDPATPIDRLREGFWQERIAIPLTDWPDGRIIRVSTHFYNTEAEIDRLVGVMARLRLLPGG